MADIHLINVCKSYGKCCVLDHFSAVFPQGEISCIMAPSGAGKTTLLRILMGLERADAGRVTGLEGRKMGAVFQEDRLVEGLSGAGNILLVRPDLNREKIVPELRKLGLDKMADRPCAEYSGGMKRRTAILRALLFDADTLFLDEPFQGLDRETKLLVMAYTKEKCRGRTVLFVTHDRAEAQQMGEDRNILLFSQKADGS